MKKGILTIIFLITSLFCFGVYAQMEERGLTREGNKFVKDSLFVMAEVEYLKSLDIQDFDTNRFNMAFAMLGQEKFDEAIEEWESVEKTSEDKVLKSYCAYNSGGAFVMQQKNDEAIEKYKQALRYFPKNDFARHNYWLLKLMKDQNPQQNQDQQNQDQNQDQDQDQDQNQDNKDQDNKDQKNQDDQNQDSKDGENQEKDEQDQGEDDKSEDDNKDGESDDKSEEEKSEDEKDQDSGSEEEEDKSDEEQNGDSEDEQDGSQENNGEGEELKEGELSTGDALRLLESLDKEEDKTQEKIKAKLLKGKKSKKHEKDW